MSHNSNSNSKTDSTFNELVTKLAGQLSISEEQAASFIKQEQSRTLAGKRYRESAAYQLRLKQQKAVRLALKGLTV